MFEVFLAPFQGPVVGTIISLVFNVLPFVLPILLVVACYKLYMTYKRLSFIATLETVLLEIVLPQEVERSAAAMELVLNAFQEASTGTVGEAYMEGKVRPWFSLELISNGGNVRLFVWTWVKYRIPIQNAFYSQYPDIEIRVVPDYTKSVLHNPTERFVWGANFKLDKDDVLPIKTYIDYGLDKDPDEVQKIDPMTPLLEYLGAISPQEKVWIQILIRAHKPETWKQGEWKDWSLVEKKDGKRSWGPGNKEKDWRSRIDDHLKEIKEKAKMKGTEDKPSPYPMIVYEPGQDDTIKSLRRHQGKVAFDALIRGFYIAESGSINPSHITGLIGAFKQYAGDNVIKLGNYTDLSDPMKDVLRFIPSQAVNDYFKKKKRWEMEEELFDAYKKRSIFYPPHRHEGQKPYVLDAEEIASLFHVVGSVARTPTIERLESKKAEPPSDLPV